MQVTLNFDDELYPELEAAMCTAFNYEQQKVAGLKLDKREFFEDRLEIFATEVYVGQEAERVAKAAATACANEIGAKINSAREAKIKAIESKRAVNAIEHKPELKAELDADGD